MDTHTPMTSIPEPVNSIFMLREYFMRKKPLSPILAVVSILLLTSCASNNGRESLRQQINTIQASTEQARQASEAAEAMATRNQAELQALRRDVEEARELAAQANARVDNAFKASQIK